MRNELLGQRLSHSLVGLKTMFGLNTMSWLNTAVALNTMLAVKRLVVAVVGVVLAAGCGIGTCPLDRAEQKDASSPAVQPPTPVAQCSAAATADVDTPAVPQPLPMPLPAGTRDSPDTAGEPGASSETDTFTSCSGEKTVLVPKELRGQALADALMDQWKRDHPGRDWVAEEREKHGFPPPADNSHLLQGEQGKGHAYGNFSERDILIWARETEKLVAEGSRIFHSAEALGSEVAVSCDMCHPHAANTHPETYPKFQTQLGRVALLRDMIDWCIEHPVRGKHLDPNSPEMRALEAYILAQRKGVKLEYGKH